MDLEFLKQRVWPRTVAVAGERSAEIGDCWEWTAALTKVGYGEVSCGGGPVLVHRLVYYVAVGIIPEGMLVRHRCDNRRCCRPGHLVLGTFADNSKDMVERGRSTKGRPQHPNGHVQGEQHGHHKLTADQVEAIRARYATGGITQTQLGREFGVSGAHVCGIVSGRFWRPAEMPALQNEAG